MLIEPRFHNAAGGVAVGHVVVGLFPVALAVPEGAGLVERPELVGLRPYLIIKGHVLLSWCCRARGQPPDVGEQPEVVGVAELLPLFACPGTSHSGVVLCRLIKDYIL